MIIEVLCMIQSSSKESTVTALIIVNSTVLTTTYGTSNHEQLILSR